MRDFPVQLSPLTLSEISRDRLSELDVVILAGLTNLSREHGEVIRAFVEAGGGLWICPPSDPELAREFSLASPLGQLLPARELKLIEGRSGLPASAPYDHAITGFWNTGKAGTLSSFFSDTYWEMAPAEGAETVLALNNGAPLFLGQSSAAGRIFLSALPLDGSWSQLPLSPQFVPLVQRTLQWLNGSVESLAAVSPGEGWRVRVPAINVGRPFYAQTPWSEGAAQLAGQVEFQSGQAILAYTDTRALGRYQLYLDPEASPVGSFGVNLVPYETDLRPVSSQQLEDILGSSLINRNDSEQTQKSLADRMLGALPDLWVILVTLILLTGAVELTHAQRYSRTER